MSELLSTSRIYYLVPVVKREAGNREKSAPVTVYIWMLYLDTLNLFIRMSTVPDCQCENRFPQWDSRSEKSPPVEIFPSAAAHLSRARTPLGLSAVFKYFLPFTKYFSYTHLTRWPGTWGSPWVWRCCPLPSCGWPGGRWCRWTARTPPCPWSGRSGAASRTGTRRMFPGDNHKVKWPPDNARSRGQKVTCVLACMTSSEGPSWPRHLRYRDLRENPWWKVEKAETYWLNHAE